jgi:hypothetical protein
VIFLNGWFCLHRGITDHWIYKDSEHLKVWIEILTRTRYLKEPKTDTYEGILYTLNYGEFIFGRQSWSKRLKIGEQKLRTLIEKLTNENMLGVRQKSTRFTIYFVVNYEKYNQLKNQPEDIEAEGDKGTDNLPDNLLITYGQPTDNLLVTTKNKDNHVNHDNQGNNNKPPIIPHKVKPEKVKPEKTSYAEYVTMTNAEYEKLLATYGKEMTDRLIEVLDNYKGSNGKNYKSDYRAILNWVVGRVKEEQEKDVSVSI